MNIYYKKNTDCKLKLLNFDFNKLNPLHYDLCTGCSCLSVFIAINSLAMYFIKEHIYQTYIFTRSICILSHKCNHSFANSKNPKNVFQIQSLKNSGITFWLYCIFLFEKLRRANGEISLEN